MRSFTYLGAVGLLVAVTGCGSSNPNNNTDGSVSTGDPIADEWIEAHNDARAMAGPPTPSPELPALTWNTAGATTAQAWAEGCNWMHNPNRGNFGENIAAFSGNSTPTQTVSLWNSEKADYDYAGNTCPTGKVCGHYTQLVWRKTTSVGCGIAKCTTGSPLSGFPDWTYLVCDYAPPGNFNNAKPY